LTFKGKIHSLIRHPSIALDLIAGKSSEEIREKVRKLKDREAEADVFKFISKLRQSATYHPDPNGRISLNKLCCIEDSDNEEMASRINKFQNKLFYDRCGGILARKPGLIHRKDWEWALGSLAMKRFGKLNENCIAIGVGAGKEAILYYLANHLKHVYATDLYKGDGWNKFSPPDFISNPRKYAPFQYNESALTALKMDGRKLKFPSDSFDIAFSFSSIEHFGGTNHAGALASMMEIERVLKPGGLAVISTEYILNDKEAPDLSNQFFNRRTIYSELINRLDRLKLVEPLDLRISTKTLNVVIDALKDNEKWDLNKYDEEYKKANPYILLKMNDILFTSVMLVFQKSLN
jgi:SAM-dependent methyltransferase